MSDETINLGGDPGDYTVETEPADPFYIEFRDWKGMLAEKLGSRKFILAVIAVLTVVQQYVVGALSPQEAAAGVLAAVIAYLAAEAYVDGRRA